MRFLTAIYTTLLFIGSALAAEATDAEIIKDLDFYQNMGVVENLDFLETESEMHADTHRGAAASPTPAPSAQSPRGGSS